MIYEFTKTFRLKTVCEMSSGIFVVGFVVFLSSPSLGQFE